MVFIKIIITTFVYGCNAIDDRQRLWHELKNIHIGVTETWCICGDFNAVKDMENRINGQRISDHETRDFIDFLDTCNVFEMTSTGEKYTWSNGHVSSKIDWALCNPEWGLKYSHIVADFGVCNISYHTPIFMRITDPQHGSRNFKFLNILADDPQFLPLVQQAWDTWNTAIRVCAMYRVWRKLSVCKQMLKHLFSTKYNSIDKRVDDAREKLAEFKQTNDLSDTQAFFDEKELRVDLEKWSSIQEKIFHQKSRDQWVQTGDGNNSYFYAVMKARSAAKNISAIHDEHGNRLTKNADIQEEVIRFYKQLMGTSIHNLPSIDINVMRRGPMLNREQQLALCAQVSEEEIQLALACIGDNKAPGVDGFNAFFKRTLGIIKQDIIEAVQDFFQNGKILRAINCTYMTLIPKTSNASR